MTAVGGEFRAQTAQRLVQAFDTIHGGLGGAPKFPQAPILDLLWREALASGDAALRHAVSHTLVNICQGGIYDHLGGGFARYSVDALWLVPHFEKMLYDNAQLLMLLADVSADGGSPLLAARAAETVGWLEREMLVGDAFASSLDADSEGEEGRFYVWQGAEIDRLLGADAAAFRLAYGVTDNGNWEGSTVLNRLHQPGLLAPDEESRLRASADRLLAARALRVRPGRDDKVLADWNGLMIAALARASAVFGRPDWLERARRAFAFVTREMMADDRLAHSWRAGERLDLAFLEDYANLSAAALALHEHTADDGYLAQALRWLGRLEADYLDAEHGGCFQIPADASDVLVRAKNAQDGPTPAGNGTMLGVLGRLWLLTGDQRHRARAEQLLAAFSGEAKRNPAVHAALLAGTLWLDEPVQVVVIGERGEAGLRRAPRDCPGGAAGRDGGADGGSGRLSAGQPPRCRQGLPRRSRHRLCLPRSDMRAADHRARRARPRARAGQLATGILSRQPRCLAPAATRSSLSAEIFGRGGQG